MFHNTATLSIFALLLAVASCRPQEDLYDCSGKEDGPHADPLDNKAFYVCFHDELIARSTCDGEEFFDDNLKSCTGGSEEEDLTRYSDESEDDLYVKHMKSEVSDLLNESLEQLKRPNYPPNRPPQPPPQPTPPTPTPPESSPLYKNKIINIQVTDNIFPKSFIVIGRANREQKNK